MKPSFVAETTFHVRYAETDAMGIVHHASYIVYFEEGRSDYIRQRGTSYAVLEAAGHSLAVTDINVRYVKPARYDDRITIRTWIAEIRSRSLTFQYEISHTEQSQILVTGQSKHICLTPQGTVTTIPQSWHEWLYIH